MKIDSRQVVLNKALSDITDNKHLAAYLAVAKLYLEIFNTPVRVSVKKFAYELNEISIIDITLLEKVIFNLYEYIVSFSKPSTIFKTINKRGVISAFLIDNYIDPTVLEAVDKHYDVYANVYNNCRDIIKELGKSYE